MKDERETDDERETEDYCVVLCDVIKGMKGKQRFIVSCVQHSFTGLASVSLTER